MPRKETDITPEEGDSHANLTSFHAHARSRAEECSLRAQTCAASHDMHLLIAASIAALSLLTPRIRSHSRLHGPSYVALLAFLRVLTWPFLRTYVAHHGTQCLALDSFRAFTLALSRASMRSCSHIPFALSRSRFHAPPCAHAPASRLHALPSAHTRAVAASYHACRRSQLQMPLQCPCSCAVAPMQLHHGDPGDFIAFSRHSMP